MWIYDFIFRALIIAWRLYFVYINKYIWGNSNKKNELLRQPPPLPLVTL